MTTPATFNTPSRLIRMAMQDAGLLQEGASPNSEQLANNIQRLNDIINFLQTQGLKLWLQYDLEVPLVVGQSKYVLSPTGDIVMTKPLRVLQGYYLESGGTQRPLTAMSRDEFLRLSNLSQQGALNSYFVDKRDTSLDVTFWLTPDAQAVTGTAHLLIQQQVTNFIGLTDSANLPQEWFIALRWALADDISTGQPQAIVDRCSKKAAQFMVALEAWDVEDASTYFIPDERIGQNTGRFT